MLLRRLLACLLLLGCLLANSPAMAKERASGTIKLFFVGDIMIADDQETGKRIERGDDLFELFASLLAPAAMKP